MSETNELTGDGKMGQRPPRERMSRAEFGGVERVELHEPPGSMEVEFGGLLRVRNLLDGVLRTFRGEQVGKPENIWAYGRLQEARDLVCQMLAATPGACTSCYAAVAAHASPVWVKRSGVGCSFGPQAPVMKGGAK